MTPTILNLWRGLGIAAIALLSLALIAQSRSRQGTVNLAQSSGTYSAEPSAESTLPTAPPTELSPAALTTETVAAEIDFKQRWFISANEAQRLIDQGATLLDARGKQLGQQRWSGAQSIAWDQFSPKDASTRGRLLADDGQLTRKLQALGISASKPVVVFGDPLNGWGEEGRIVWMLRSLGHSQAVMVDGGISALRRAIVALPSRAPAEARQGDFVVQRRSDWDIRRDTLKTQLGSANLVVVDTREPREFSGQTPYGERRGGHIPGAVNLYFKDVLGPDGTLLPEEAIASKLAQLGITPDRQIVVYCTGGIRSGWLAAVLTSLGFSVQNYAGSMWEWSASPAAAFPLTAP